MIAESLAPIQSKPVISDAASAAQFAFGPMMMGVRVELPEQLNPVEQVKTLLRMMAEVIVPIEESGGMANEQQIIGLNTVAAYVSQLIQRIGMDEQSVPMAKQYNQQLSELMNYVKAFEQRLQEQMQAQGQNGGMSPEAQAKILDAGIVAETKARINEASSAQKMANKQQQFDADQQRKDVQTAAEINRKMLQAQADIAVQGATAKAEPAQ